MNYCDALFNLDNIEAGRDAFFEIDTGKRITFNGLRDQIKVFASYLLKMNIMKGDAVAIHLHNSINTIIVHMATQYIGAVSCLIDPLAQPKSLFYYVNETETKLLITHVPVNQLTSDVTEATSILHESDIQQILLTNDLCKAESKPFDWNKSDTCYIYYTSGTTSNPKGVELTQGTHENFIKISDIYWQPVDMNSRHICYVPFSHGFGTIFLVPLTIRTGSQLYILRSFHPGKVAETIDKYDITHIYGVPSHYQQLMRFEGFHNALKKLKLAFCAASKLEHETMKKWEDVTGILLNEGYGLIETDAGIVWRVGYKPLGTGHMGVCPDRSLLEIGIMDENNCIMSPGEEGEIVVRGASVMKGYFKKPEENKRVFIDGWFKTGDRGYITTDDQLFMTGRIKDIINIAGIKISPYEVEAVLMKHEAVAQAVVVAIEDSLYGEVVKAYIQKKTEMNLSAREIIKFASEHLINFQVPKIVEFVDFFPLNNIGKVDRNKLRTIK